MKKVILTASVLVLSLTLIFAQKGKNKTKNQINLIPLNTVVQDSAAQALAKQKTQDSLAAIAALNQPPIRKPNNGLPTLEAVQKLLANLGTDTSKVAKEVKTANKIAGYPSGFTSRMRVDTLFMDLNGYQSVIMDSGKLVFRDLAPGTKGIVFVVSDKGKVYLYNRRLAPLKKGAPLEGIEKAQFQKLTTDLTAHFSEQVVANQNAINTLAEDLKTKKLADEETKKELIHLIDSLNKQNQSYTNGSFEEFKQTQEAQGEKITSQGRWIKGIAIGGALGLVLLAIFLYRLRKGTKRLLEDNQQALADIKKKLP